MSGRRRAREVVRPDELEDVEKEGDEEMKEDVEKEGHVERNEEPVDEDERGEEPGVVEMPQEGKRERRKEAEEPGRIGKEEGGGRMRSLGDPRLPSKKEVEEHYLAHVPYRNWCPHCVMGAWQGPGPQEGLRGGSQDQGV